jgi:glutamate dehydrogenase/leucine dehydrogenase
MNDILEPAAHTLQALLYALAAVTGEVAEQLEITSSDVGKDLAKCSDLDRAVIVKLQGFDRMRQQLTAVSEGLKRCSALISNCDAAAPQSVESIISQITMRQMRHRLQDALAAIASSPVAREAEDDAVF